MHLTEEATRPEQVTLIGFGDIGGQLMEKLGTTGAANRINVWNRTPFAEKLADKDASGAIIDLKTGQDRVTALELGCNQANLVACKELGVSPPSFSLMSGDDQLEASMRGSKIIVITAGESRKKGQSGADGRKYLLEKNPPIIEKIAAAAKHAAPDATYIICTNPVDAMTQYFHEKSGIPTNQIVGLSGELDWTRLVESICHETKVHGDAIRGAEVVGEHGGTMVPVLDKIEIRQQDRSWKKLTDYPPETLAAIVKATVSGGGLFVDYLGKSDGRAPAAAIFTMIKQLLGAEKNQEASGPINCSAFDKDLGVYIGRTVNFQPDGTYVAEPVTELKKRLSYPEILKFDASVAACNKTVGEIPGRPADFSLAA